MNDKDDGLGEKPEPEPKGPNPETPSEKADRLRLILQACSSACAPKELISRSGLPQSTVYRLVDELGRLGWLEKFDGQWLMTPAGRKRLESGQTDPSGVDRSNLETLHACLAPFPTPVHRALAELAVYARIARESFPDSDCHPGFVLVGPTMKMKSWWVKGMCTMAHIKVEECRVIMMNESGRSVLSRSDSRGNTVFEREVHKQPFAWFEEFDVRPLSELPPNP